jgi:sialic acid synthase SpsE
MKLWKWYAPYPPSTQIRNIELEIYKMNATINLRGKPRIGYGCSEYLIAEIGTNHNQDFQIARDLVKTVAEVGFDCAKFQIYESDEIVSGNVRASDYGLEQYYGDISAAEMFDKYLKTPKEWFPELRDLCHQCGIDCATTIHGSQGLDWSREMNFDLIKIASMDHNNLPFLRSLVNTIDAPILVSFGMAALADIDAAVATLSRHYPGLGIFHCVSLYPPRPEELRLSNIPFLRHRFPVPVGFSDHSDDVITSLAALTLGSCLFEKHVTLNKKSHGPDHPFALEPNQMRSYVNGLRILANSLNSGQFEVPTSKESANRTSYLKSIIAARDLPVGHKLENGDLTLVRPGTGIPPKEMDAVIGRAVRHPLQQGAVLTWDDLDS